MTDIEQTVDTLEQMMRAHDERLKALAVKSEKTARDVADTAQRMANLEEKLRRHGFAAEQEGDE